MFLHANAKLGLAGRLGLVRAIEQGCSLRQAEDLPRAVEISVAVR